MQASIHTFEPTGDGSALLDDGRLVHFAAAVFERSGLRHLRPGQRLSIVLGEDGTISRMWIVGIGEDQQIH